jgi:hypothetical protein
MKVPKNSKTKIETKTKPKAKKLTFKQAFKLNKDKGNKTFTWNNKKFTTQTKDEVSKKGTRSTISKLKKKKRADVKKAKGFKAKRKIRKAFRKAKRTIKKSNKIARKY